MAETDIDIVVTLKDKASKGLGVLRGKMGALSSMAGKIMKAGLLAGGVAIVAIGAAALKFGNDFKESANIIRTGTGATGEDLKGLKEDFKAAFADTPGDMKEVAQTTADLNTALGLTGEPLQNLTAQLIDLSRITETDVATNTKKITRLFGDWAVATDDQEAALDGLFRTSQATGAPVDRLASLMVTFGAPLRQLNFSIDESAALLGKWEREGVNTELVMGALKLSIAKFAKEGIPLRQGLDDTIAKIQALGPGAESTGIAMEVFGARAGGDLAAAILEGKFEIGDLMDQLEGGTDTIRGVAEETETWQDKLKKLRNKALVKLEPVLTGFVDVLGDAADWLGEKIPLAMNLFIGAFEGGGVTSDGLAGKIEEIGIAARSFLDKAIPIVKEFAGAFITGLETIAPLAKDLFNFIIDNKAVMIAAIVAIGVAILLALGPVSLGVIAIIALIALVGFLKENWESVPAPIKVALEVLRKIFEDKIAGVIGIVQGLIDFVKEMVEFVKAIVRGDWAAAWESLKNLAKIALNLFLSFLKITFIGTIISVLSALNVWKHIKATFNGLVGKIKGVATDVGAAAFSLGRSIINGIVSGVETGFFMVRSAINTLIGGAESGINFMITGIDNLGHRLNSIGSTISDVVGFFGGPKLPTIPHLAGVTLPRLHQGGEVIRGGLAQVKTGEHFSDSLVTVKIGTIHLGAGATNADMVRLVDVIEREMGSRRRRGF